MKKNIFILQNGKEISDLFTSTKKNINTLDKVNYIYLFIENLYNNKLLKDEIAEKVEHLEKVLDQKIINEIWDIIQYTKRKYLEYGAILQITQEEYNPEYKEK